MGCLPVKPVSADPAEVKKPEKATKNRLTKKLNSVSPGSLSIKRVARGPNFGLRRLLCANPTVSD